MIEFRDGSQPHTYDMRRDRMSIGYLQCSPGFEARIIIENTDRLEMHELQQIIAKVAEVTSHSS